jgi:hypothetical protein
MKTATRSNTPPEKAAAVGNALAAERGELTEFITKKGIRVRVESNLSIELLDSCNYGCAGYDISLPESEEAKSWRRVGQVYVSSWRMRDYYCNLKSELAARGLGDGDVVSEITYFYPLEQESLRSRGVGGGVLEEVVERCRDSGSSAVYCITNKQEMLRMLRNRRFGFEELPDFPGEFIMVFE